MERMVLNNGKAFVLLLHQLYFVAKRKIISKKS